MTVDGRWRPDAPFEATDGLLMTMRKAEKLTPAGVLEVPFRFQVPLMNSLDRPWKYNWSTQDLLVKGQTSRRMGKQLLDLSLDTMFMDRLAAESSEGLIAWSAIADPERFIEELRFIGGMDDERKGPAAIFRLTIAQPTVWNNPVVNMLCSLTAVTPSQQPGEVATEFVSMAFLEWWEEDVGVQRRGGSSSGGGAGGAKVGVGNQLAPYHSGDTLYEVAKGYLRRSSDWRKIAVANGISGVSPDSASELERWMKRHHKSSYVIPRG